MNLQGLVVGYISAINPQQPASVLLSTGPGSTQPDGSRIPAYEDPFTVSAQVQPISTGDLRKLDALNIQGVNQKVYINGSLRGLQRVKKLGGDLVVLDCGDTYLVKAVLEQWPDWVSAAVVLQNPVVVSASVIIRPPVPFMLQAVLAGGGAIIEEFQVRNLASGGSVFADSAYTESVFAAGGN